MKFPKLDIVNYIFNRPEYSGSFGEHVREYLRYKESNGVKDPIAEVEGEVLISIKDYKEELKSRQKVKDSR